MKEQVIAEILQSKIIAILRKTPPQKLGYVAEALCKGGISLMELTFDQSDPASWEETCTSIRYLCERFDGNLTVGAGTVLTSEQVKMAYQAGAKYIISPDTNPVVIRDTQKLGLVSMPGALTPTEIAAALAAGADLIKLFPAGIMGSAYINAIRAPFSHAKCIAVGGIDEKNAAAFLKAGCVGIGVGGNLVNREWIANNEFDRIRALAAAYQKAVQEA